MTARDITSGDLFLVHHSIASPFFQQALATRGGLLAYLFFLPLILLFSVILTHTPALPHFAPTEPCMSAKQAARRNVHSSLELNNAMSLIASGFVSIKRGCGPNLYGIPCCPFTKELQFA
jgi:hypothetical protein